MKQIAFASFEVNRDDFDATIVTEDERLLQEPLKARGIRVTTIPWDAPDTDWTAFDAVVIRSTWDYHLRWEAFSAWLDRLEAQHVTVLNPIPMLRWNMDKVYLGTLGQHDIPTLPTLFVERGQHAQLVDILREQGWQRGVVKPTISAGGDNTWRFDRDNAAALQSQLDDQLTRQTVMIQKYADRITEGEWSFHFFNGIYSHTVNKVPAVGEMFVHLHRGGHMAEVTPTPAQIAQASNIVRTVQVMTGDIPLYARVDVVVNENNVLQLMELELVEPYLYLPYADALAVERLADAIAQRV